MATWYEVSARIVRDGYYLDRITTGVTDDGRNYWPCVAGPFTRDGADKARARCNWAETYGRSREQWCPND